MALVGGLCFCTDCGGLLDRPVSARQSAITCDACGTANESEFFERARPAAQDLTRIADKWPVTQTTRSRPDAFPSVLQRKNRTNIQEIDPEKVGGGIEIQQTCPKCGNPEMEYRELQLRSADEGSTIFFSCPKCGHQYSTNN